MEMLDNSNHICLICNTTIVGLLQYVEHYRSHAIPTDNYVEDLKPFVLSPLKHEQHVQNSSLTDSNEVNGNTSLSKPVTSSITSQSLSQPPHNSNVYCDETSPLSAFSSQDFPDPEIDTDPLLSPKYNIDFFQSLELKSTNEEVTPRSKLKATQKLSILEDDMVAESLLPITSILSNLDFSSDDEDCVDPHDQGQSSEWNDEYGADSSSRHPPQTHTGGKWKPGQGPGRKNLPIAQKWRPGQGPGKKNLPIAQKWKPGQRPAPASHKNIMKKKAKPRGPRADIGKEFKCIVCKGCFSNRSTYSLHFGKDKHKAAVAERRQNKEPSSVGQEVSKLSERGVLASISRPTNEEGNQVSSKTSDERYRCTVCDLYFSNGLVFQTHCDTKVHKDNLLKQGFKEYRRSDGGIIRVDVNSEAVYADCQENQLLAAKLPRKITLPANATSDDEKHECTVCRKVFKRKYEMARHLLTRMHRVRAESKPLEEWTDMLHKYNKYMMRLCLFQCGICQFYFNRRHDFLDHMCSPQHVKNCADMLGPIMCVACRFKTHKHSEIMQHLYEMDHHATVEKCHGIVIIRESHTKITCKFCGVKMHSAVRIKHHCQLRHADRLTEVHETMDVKQTESNHHKCPICQKVFRGKTLLQFHFVKIHQNNYVFKCDICHRGFQDQLRLDNHVRTRYHAKRVIAENVKGQGNPPFATKDCWGKRKTKISANVEADDDDDDDNDDDDNDDVVSLPKPAISNDDSISDNRIGCTKKQTFECGVNEKDIKNAFDQPRRSGRRRKAIEYKDFQSDFETDNKGGKGKQKSTTKKKLKTGMEVKDKVKVKTATCQEENGVNSSREGDDGVTNGGHMIVVDDGEKEVPYMMYQANRDVETNIALQEASKQLFSCTYCDFAAMDLMELRSHYNETHPNDILTCQPCNQYFLSLKAYKIHCAGRGHQLKLREQSGQTTIHKCPHCDKCFLQESFCSLHVESIHRHPSSEADLHRIHKGTDLVTQLYGDHVAQVEKLTNDSSVSCPECGKFVRKDTLVEHLRLHTGERPYSCRFCTKSFAGRLTLRRHISSHLDMPLYICDLCGKEFKRNAHLLKHIRQHDYEKKGKKYSCNICSVWFYIPEELTRHMRRHGERSVNCTWPGCKWTFVNAGELKSHMYTHTKEKKYLCDMCGFGAPTKTRLRRHAKIHESNRSFVCEYCPYKASCNTHLKRHMRIHINSKPYSCPYCKYRCNTHENIRKHILKTQKHKGLKLYPCQLCTDFGCDSSREFRTHLMTVHVEYLRQNSVDSLAVFSGLYKREEDYQKPQEGSEIVQVTKGRFFKTYQNPGSAPPQKHSKPKKVKKESANPKMKVVILSPEELEIQTSQPKNEQQNIDINELAGQSHETQPLEITIVQQDKSDGHENNSSQVIQQLNKELQLTVDGGTIPQYVQVPSVVIHEAFSNNVTHQILPVSYSVTTPQHEQLQQQLQQISPSVSISNDDKVFWAVETMAGQTLTVEAPTSETWYSGIPQVHTPADVIENVSSIECHGQGEVSDIGIHQGQTNQADDNGIIPGQSAFLSGKYYNVTTTQIYDDGGENRVMVLDQTASDV